MHEELICKQTITHLKVLDFFLGYQIYQEELIYFRLKSMMWKNNPITVRYVS